MIAEKIENEMKEGTCPECGEPEMHWINTSGIFSVLLGEKVEKDGGFWTCKKFYGPDGCRLEDV